MRKNSAITFIELLVVIIIIGILASVSIPQLRKTFDNLELNNFAKDIYYLCQYLQASAISQNRIYCLNISPGEGKLSATYKNEEGKPEKAEGRFGKEYELPTEVSISDPKDAKEVYFYPDGSATEMTIAFENRQKRRVSLSIKGVTGAITIKEETQ